MKKKRRIQPQNSFERLVTTNVQKALNNHMQVMQQQVLSQVRADVKHTLSALDIEIGALIEIVKEKLGVSSEEFQDRMLNLEDKLVGLEVTTEAIATGDRVRFEVAEQDKLDVTRQLMLDNVGFGPYNDNHMFKDVEAALIGMTTGESKNIDLKIGDQEFKYNIKVARVSRKVKTEEAATTN